MVSFAVRHVADTALAGGRILPSRRKGAASGRVVATRRHFGIATSYQIDEQNGSARTTVPVVFPDAKYAALGYTPSRTGYRFLGWYDAPSGGTQVTAADQVRYGVSPVYAHWQDHVAVTFDAATNGGAMPQGWTAPYYFAGQPFGALPVPAHPTLNFGGWYLGDDRVTSASLVPANGAALVARYVSSTYVVDLSGWGGGPVWTLGDPSQPITYTYTYWDWDPDTDEDVEVTGTGTYTPPANPDPSAYDGVYCSLNAGQDDTTAWMKVHVVGYASFRVLIRSYAEDDYDYVVALNADEDPSGLPTGYDLAEEAKVKASTQGGQRSGTSAADYTAVDYELGGGEHDIWIGYTKDGSEYGNDDRGFVLIPKVQGGGS